MLINNYNHFLLEHEFNSILFEIERIYESEGRWIDDRTYEWDLTNKDDEGVLNKIKKFVDKLPKELIKSYFTKLMNQISNLPKLIRRRLIIGISSIFISVIGLDNLMIDQEDRINPEIKKEIVELNSGSNFEEAQKIVKFSEAGYSDDREDSGNWIDVEGGKRFVGTKFGISAQTLSEYLGKTPKKEDMMSLSYNTACEIFKSKYWKKQNLDLFCNQSVANILYDGCVNQGIGTTKLILKKALKMNGIKITPADNPFDKKWIKQANSLDQMKLHQDIKDIRERKYKQAPTWSIHGDGWIKRLNGLNFSSEENNNQMS